MIPKQLFFLFFAPLLVPTCFLAQEIPYHFSSEILEKAVRTEPVYWVYKGKHQYFNRLDRYNPLFLVALAAHQAPELVIAGEALKDNLHRKMSYSLVHVDVEESRPREVLATGGLQSWSENTWAWCCLLAKRNPVLWDTFSLTEKKRIDLTLKALAVAAHYCTDDDNGFHEHVNGDDNTAKWWAPNHVEGDVMTIAATGQFFGPDNLNQFFTGFDWESFTTELTINKLTNITNSWDDDPLVMGRAMNGGSSELGSGLGVRNPYTYKGVEVSSPFHLWLESAKRMYHKTVISGLEVNDSEGHPNGYQVYCLDAENERVVSPYEGMTGMCTEFDYLDAGGTRSCMNYVWLGWHIDITSLASLISLELTEESEESGLWLERLIVGSEDFLFKAEGTYHGWSKGHPAIKPGTELESPGLEYIREIYLKVVKPYALKTVPSPEVDRRSDGYTEFQKG